MGDNSKDDLMKKYEFSRDIFRQMWELNEHEDTKAARVLTAVAFLALTAVTVFEVFVASHLSVQVSFSIFHFDLIPFSLAIFIIFVSLGAFAFLEASLTGFRVELGKNEQFKIIEDTGEKKFSPQSFFYYKSISNEDPNKWISYFEEGVLQDLLSKAYSDHIRETFSISKKTRRKVGLYKLGKVFFYVAIIFFIILTLAGCYALV
jgi:hypothetical protein